MTALAPGMRTGVFGGPPVAIRGSGLCPYGHAELNYAFEVAKWLSFDDHSRFVFFSDCHRGDGSRADAFACNESLFAHALDHYYRQGFTYVEVGDGDELWQNQRLADIRRAHTRTFDLLHQFDRDGRLHIVLGNHDVQGPRHCRVEKDGIPTYEGLALRHVKGSPCVFVTHGHQADFTSDRLRLVGRLVVRHIWKRLHVLGLVRLPSDLAERREVTAVQQAIARLQRGAHRLTERRIAVWAQRHGHIIICGHTHRPAFASPGAVPYFNTGSCVNPGFITGIEMRDGAVALVRWSAPPPSRTKTTPSAKRLLVAPPTRLAAFDCN